MKTKDSLKNTEKSKQTQESIKNIELELENDYYDLENLANEYND